MQNFSIRTLFWMMGCIFLFNASSIHFKPIDPTDDLSNTVRQNSEMESHFWVPEKVVAQIFHERLDLFPKAKILKLSKHLIELCKIYQFDPAFILGMIQVESEFRVKAVSHRKAFGLMQIQLPTARYVVETVGLGTSGFENFNIKSLESKPLTPKVLSDPFVNISIGIAYLGWLRDHYEVSTPYHLLAAYNMGPTRVNHLIAKKDYYPEAANRYFKAVLREIPDLRFYRRDKSDMKL